jgi:hypothetical protein
MALDPDDQDTGFLVRFLPQTYGDSGQVLWLIVHGHRGLRASGIAPDMVAAARNAGGALEPFVVAVQRFNIEGQGRLPR